MILDKRVLGLCEVTATDKSREMLTGVKIESDRAYATDGYMLMVIKLDDQAHIPGEESGPTEYEQTPTCVVPASVLKEIAKTIKPMKYERTIPKCNVIYSTPAPENEVTLNTWVSGKKRSIQAKRLDITPMEYPNVDRIITAQDKKKKTRITFNPKKMVRLLNALMLAGANENMGITLSITGELDAIILTGKDTEQREIKALLMPIRRTE